MLFKAMANDLPSNFDVIIVGTGLVECIVSAAASRIGKNVLQLDSNDFYGGQWASFNLKTFNENPFKKHEEDPNNDNSLLKLHNSRFIIKDFAVEWHIPEKVCQENTEPTDELKNENEQSKFSQEIILQDSRKFNIDLMPKLHFAKGDFVELLISSNIARYTEYRSVSRVLTWLNKQLEIVPCSRSDVFASKKISVIEKRILMKLLTSINDSSTDVNDNENKTFFEFLKEQKLTDNLINFVLYAISQSTATTPYTEGVAKTKRFLTSLGRFGKTPFLFSMYGSGETPQAFCRLSAVFGGIFALNQNLKGLKLDDNNKITTLVTDHQEIQSQHFVLSLENVPVDWLDVEPQKYISRAVFITDQSVMPSEQEHLTLLTYPPENDKNMVKVIEMGSRTGTCPKDFYLIHLIAKQHTNPKQDFEHVVKNIFTLSTTEEKPNILWSCYFSLPEVDNLIFNNNSHPSNVSFCLGPDFDLDYDLSIIKAREIYHKIYPNLEFLPRAPDPEDIIFVDEENEIDSENSNTTKEE